MKRMRISAIILLAVCVAIVFGAAVSAMPPYPGLENKIGMGKITVPYYLQHQSELRQKGLDAPSVRHGNGLNTDAMGKSSVSGIFKILTLLVDFSTKTSSVNSAEFDTLIYLNVSGSVTNYYDQVSYSTLSISSPVNPSTLGWYRAPQTYAYYVNAQNGTGAYPQNSQKLVEDLVDLVDPYVDFSQFDNDNDGYVDGLIIVHAGPGAEFTGNVNDIWSHKWSINPRLKDGVYVFDYSINPEYWSAPGDITLGVYCHELGHILGLPDLYDTDYSSEGVGSWSLMAGGSWNGPLGGSPAHLDAWSKIFLGFVTPTTLAHDQLNVSFPQVETSQTIYKLWTNGTPVSEYFLVENRQKIGYDSYLTSGGMLIWHIDDTRPGNTNEWWPGSGLPGHYKVALVQADNTWALEHNINNGDGGDPFPGTSNNRAFSYITSPNSNSYAGTETSVSVVSISNSGAGMTADLAVGSPQGVLADNSTIPDKVRLLGNLPNPFNPETQIRFEVVKETPVLLEVYGITGQKITTLANGTMKPGMYSIGWRGKNYENKEVGSGVYFYKMTLDDKILNGKMTKLK